VVAIQSRISLSAKTSWQDVHLCLASGHVVVEVVAPCHVVVVVGVGVVVVVVVEVVVVVAIGQLPMESCSTYDIFYTFRCSFMHVLSCLVIFISFCEMVLMKHFGMHQQHVAAGLVVAAAL